jgi:hypothetical protein
MILLNIYFEIFTLFIVLLNNIIYFAEKSSYIYMHFIHIHMCIHLYLFMYASLHIKKPSNARVGQLELRIVFLLLLVLR